MKITYAPTGINDFHNSGALVLRVTGDTSRGMGDETMYLVTKAQKRRIEKHFCGISDCRCAQGCVQQLDPDGTLFAIPAKYIHT